MDLSMHTYIYAFFSPSDGFLIKPQGHILPGIVETLDIKDTKAEKARNLVFIDIGDGVESSEAAVAAGTKGPQYVFTKVFMNCFDYVTTKGSWDKA